MRIKKEDDKKIEAIREVIRESKSILITSHIRPDGDAVGSLIGFGLALMNAGKKVDMVLEDGVPSNFTYLKGSELVLGHYRDDYDTIIILDCSDTHRAGNFQSSHSHVVINIDHHSTNNNFADINLVVHEAVATAEILTELIPALGLHLNQAIANALLNGIVTDTIGFRTPNVGPDTLQRAANLVELGADISTIQYKGLSERSFTGARYWGYGLMRLAKQEDIVWTSLTLKDRTLADYSRNDDADLINVLSSIEGARIAIIFVEQEQGRVKISWRTCGQGNSNLDVSKIACEFGGGGHISAAGAVVEGSLEEIERQVLDFTRAIL